MTDTPGSETDLIERYVRAVGRNLPAKIRRQAEADLLASLREQVDARTVSEGAGTGASPASAEAGGGREAIEIALLKELGPPEDQALAYLPPGSYLIGPELHGGFMAALKICLGLLVVLFVLGLGSNFGNLATASGLVGLLWQAVGQFLGMALKVFGVIVLIFAAIERAAMPGTVRRPSGSPAVAGQATTSARSSAADAWTPEAIPAADDPDGVRLGHAAFLLGLVALALVMLNLFPDWPAGWIVIADKSGFVPMLGPGFARWLWVLNLTLAIAFLRLVLLLRSGRWSVTTRLLDLAGGLVGLVWVYHLAHETEILKVSIEWMTTHGWSTEDSRRLADLVARTVDPVVRIGLWFGVVGAAIGVLGDLRRLVRTAFGR